MRTRGELFADCLRIAGAGASGQEIYLITRDSILRAELDARAYDCLRQENDAKPLNRRDAIERHAYAAGPLPPFVEFLGL